MNNEDRFEAARRLGAPVLHCTYCQHTFVYDGAKAISVTRASEDVPGSEEEGENVSLAWLFCCSTDCARRLVKEHLPNHLIWTTENGGHLIPLEEP